MEAAARTAEDFQAVVKQWNHLDKNRERRERYHEIGRPNAEMLHWDKANANDEKGKLKAVDVVIPSPPLGSMWWRSQMCGDFLDTIYDNAIEMWQLIEDWDIAALVKSLTHKQREVLFLSAVRLCTTAHIACCRDKTDRAVRKLIAAALDSVRDKLAPLIREQIETEYPQMTFAKREFLTWYDKEKAAVDSGGGE
jgi:DNA-directed RNA polymerase specialized sigma24 family protein